ncbi:hypothetical protein Ga0466249_004772 [Sporomusaceae bacterium BoRhaA]|jgi:hypothetical protein|nr:hypothetical protein [Pelorhabdus rhamnosifermentans]MBU2703627.1 hypothetical protein [Pelorhabdus rhamnosifermentans]
MREKHRDSTSEWDKEKRALKNMTTPRPSREKRQSDHSEKLTP